MSVFNITDTVPVQPTEAVNLFLLWQLARTYPDFPKDAQNFSYPNPRANDPNYVPPDQGSKIIAVAMATTCIAFVLVVCRICLRLRWSTMKFGWDDWMIIPGTLIALGLAILQVVMVARAGFGRHVYDNSFESVVLCIKLIYVHLILYYTALTFIKTSILCFIYRLTTPKDKGLRWTIWIFGIILWLYLVICCIVTSFECKPAAATYDLLVRIQDPRCMNLPTAVLVLNALLVVTDVVLVVLPIRLVWQLKLAKRQRIGILALFSLGIFICACNILKMVNIKRAYNSYDFTWSGVDVLLWSGVEAAVAIIVATVPTLNVLFLRIVPGLFGINGNSEKSRPVSYTQDTEVMEQYVEKNLQSPTSNDERASVDSAPQSSYDGHHAYGRELSLGSEPSERPFRSKWRGKRAIKTPSTLDGAMRNMWLESPGHSDIESDDGTRSEVGSEARQSWSANYQRSNSLPGHRPSFSYLDRRTPTLNSRFDNYPRHRVRSMVATGSGAAAAANAKSTPSLWPRMKLGKKKAPPGIMKTSEFSIKVDDDHMSDVEDGIVRRDEVHISYGTASRTDFDEKDEDEAEETETDDVRHHRDHGPSDDETGADETETEDERNDLDGIYKTSEIRVEHTDFPGFDYDGRQDSATLREQQQRYNRRDTFIEAEHPLNRDDDAEPGGPSTSNFPSHEGIMRHSEIKLEYSREPDSTSTRR